MFDLAVFRTGVRYGVMCALAGFAYLLILYFSGKSPYGENSYYTFLLIPIFIFLGVRYFKKYREGELGFLKAFSVGFSISLYNAFCAGMLLYAFSTFAGSDLLQQYIEEAKLMLEQAREQTVNMLGEDVYRQNLEYLEKTTPETLGYSEFVNKLFAGSLLSLVAAVFFRK